MAIENIIENVSEKTAKVLLVVLVSILTVVAAFAYTLESNWRGKVGAGIQKATETNERQDIDLARLAISTDNLRMSVERMSEQQNARSEEKAKRLDRLLDVLEKQAYNASKGGK